ncbi:MAG: carbamoyltransferase HypF [Methylococcales bacterium]|nr:carbamoyltransferase HypF [Methylococcales bacterium]
MGVFPITVSERALRLQLKGRVQGVGFRPFVYRLAHRFKLDGWVNNQGGEVVIHIQGAAASLNAFQDALIHLAPPASAPVVHTCRPVPVAVLSGFHILPSDNQAGNRPEVPPDWFMCAACFDELNDPRQRRYRYPFINCTQCGPRYTLIERLPYDRPNTSMAEFPLCAECQAEYQNPLDRRFHAQPLACSVCGPKLTWQTPEHAPLTGNEAALTQAVNCIKQGGIVAVKGIGGYHLFANALDATAVNCLRVRKRRPHQPFAVMLPIFQADDWQRFKAWFHVDDVTSHLLNSASRPIVLVERHKQCPLAPEIAPDLDEIGIMLPYSPLHVLLLQGLAQPVIATSGNLSGEPVITDADMAANRLSTVADGFLHHDRPIVRPADDSVFRSVAGTLRPLRLGRGHAPQVMPLTGQAPAMLAVGGQGKNSIALRLDDQAMISPHIGDLGTPRSQQVFEQVIADLCRLYQGRYQIIACDAHPGYSSSRWALTQNLPVIKIWHHHAHASALAGEYPSPRPWLIFTFDGAGLGVDGTLWGGEALFGQPGDWRRVASLLPYRLPGGDKASRQPWRSAAALLWQCNQLLPDRHPDLALLKHAWQQDINCHTSHAAGRLFDAAWVLLGLGRDVSHEAEAPMQLEQLARQSPSVCPPVLPLLDHAPTLIDWRPLLNFLRDETFSIAQRALGLHLSLAQAICNVVQTMAKQQTVGQIGLTGGVFQNRLLSQQTQKLLEAAGFKVYLPKRLPMNDGGLSYGQLVEAAALWAKKTPD